MKGGRRLASELQPVVDWAWARLNPAQAWMLAYAQSNTVTVDDLAQAIVDDEAIVDTAGRKWGIGRAWDEIRALGEMGLLSFDGVPVPMMILSGTRVRCTEVGRIIATEHDV